MDNSTGGVTPQQPFYVEEKIQALVESGMFDVISGKVEINIHNGQIQNIYIYKMSYKRKKT